MEVRFSNEYLEQLYIGAPIKGKPKYQEYVVEKFIKRVELLKQVENSKELAKFKSLNFEKLKGDKKDLCSIRVDKQYRLEFGLENDIIKLVEIATIEDLSKHYK